ncbi:non-ltr retroelement reverse transcriptase [Gossypium australe]|uniref:Non-ltr retroelement reverse transcriptase n=1 Tax=Gossypium australe TaxID=47621 RepID=A0A5B6W6X0_9ROSI|nr:non-ltr retroelement reverse transcriptase [Gossypium australe]
MTNADLMSIFCNALVKHVPHSFSDHCPLLIHMTQFGNRCVSTRFHFKSWWMLEESFLKEVEIIWSSTSSDLLSKLETLKSGLESWAQQIKLSREVMEKEMMRLADFIDTNVLLNFEIEKDEMYWEQRARVNWLKLGDRNTSFFHKHASQHRKELARNYFQKLFSSNGVGDSVHLLSGIKRCVTSDDNLKLTSIYTKEEMWLALKGMAPTKAYGEDCLPALFF